MIKSGFMRRLQKSPEQAYADISHWYSHGLQGFVTQAFPQSEGFAKCLITISRFVIYEPVQSPSEPHKLSPPTESCTKKSHSLIRSYVQEPPLFCCSEAPTCCSSGMHLTMGKTVSLFIAYLWLTVLQSSLPAVLLILHSNLSSSTWLLWEPFRVLCPSSGGDQNCIGSSTQI